MFTVLFLSWFMVSLYVCFRWRIVIHGGIDGFSRLPVFLKCSDNNEADTVVSYFIEAVSYYGLPLRVRCDRGGENVKVAEYMWHKPVEIQLLSLWDAVFTIKE